MMGELMRSHDWSTSPLGEPEYWPDALKVAVGTCISSRFPMVVWWGPDLVMLYNDAWQPILGDTKHPKGLGRPGAESWPETWSIVGEQFEKALNGEGSWHEDLLLASDRHGFIQESYFTYSHSPLRDASGKIAGVHSVVSETTSHVLNARRIEVLRGLSNFTIQATAEANPLERASEVLVELLCRNNPDVPFAVLYLTDAKERLYCAASAGVDSAIFSQTLEADDRDTWGIREVIRGRGPLVTSLPEPLHGGVWPEAITEVVTLALQGRGSDSAPLGAIVFGINARLMLDEHYLNFFKLVAGQLGASLSALQSIEREQRDA